MLAKQLFFETHLKNRYAIDSPRWDFKEAGTQIAVKVCPYCGKDTYKFYINVSGEAGDGLWDCKVCGKSGNLNQLAEYMGWWQPGVASVKDAIPKEKPAYPDFDALHRNLLESETFASVLDYLIYERKFTMDVLHRLKVGAYKKDDKLWFIIPYLDEHGKPVYYKARTSGGYKKEYLAPSGVEAQLFNESCLKTGLEKLLIVEGECDAISLLARGITNVVGIPGAGIKKAPWIAKIDELNPEVYIIYDNDKPGQVGAKELANRLSVSKVHNVVLPTFSVGDAVGKDVNDWIRSGDPAERAAALLELAYSTPVMSVDGVCSIPDLIAELEYELTTKGLEPTYKTPWGALNSIVGGFESGDMVGIMAQAKVGKTTMALNWLNYYAVTGIDSLLICDEMQPKRQVRKWVSLVTGTEDSPGNSKITVETLNEALAVAQGMSGDLYFGASHDRKFDSVADTIRKAVKRYGVKVVCYDNFHILVRSVEHSVAEANKLSKAFKSLAMELNILLLLIIQPRRVSEDTIISAHDAAWSSALEKDVDTMICVHRKRQSHIKKDSDFNGFVESTDNFLPHMYVKADLTRYASGGECTLFMDGATSLVREIQPNDLTVSTHSFPIEKSDL